MDSKFIKSEFLKLSKNDYIKAAFEAAMGAVGGYILPILNGQGIFSLANLKVALIGALMLGLRKAAVLFFSNSDGELMKH